MILSEKEISAPSYHHFTELNGKEELEIVAWQRIENFINIRFFPRRVEWIVDCSGEFEIPLFPYVIESAALWTGQGWTEFPVKQTPLGIETPNGGQCRVIANVGDRGQEPIPEYVKQAVLRFVNYVGEAQENAGLSHYSVNMGGAIEESWTRSSAAAAKSLELSGAADLLRYIRRAK